MKKLVCEDEIKGQDMSGFRTFGEFEKEVIDEILELDDKNLVVNAKNILSGLKEFGISLDSAK